MSERVFECLPETIGIRYVVTDGVVKQHVDVHDHDPAVLEPKPGRDLDWLLAEVAAGRMVEWED